RLGMGVMKAGLSPGSHAILLAANQPEWIVVACGLLSAGIIPVPIDPQMGKEDVSHVLSDSEGKWIFTTSSLVPMLQSQEHDHFREIVLLDVDAQHEKSWERLLADTEAPLSSASAETPAVLFY